MAADTGTTSIQQIAGVLHLSKQEWRAFEFKGSYEVVPSWEQGKTLLRPTRFWGEGGFVTLRAAVLQNL